MSSYDDDDPSADVDNGPIILAGFLGLGLGALLGWDIGGRNEANAALDWAVQTTRQCERSYRADGHDSVADCLKGAIDEVEERRREDLAWEDAGPQ